MKVIDKLNEGKDNKCPHCGATLKYNYDQRCEYCRSWVNLGVPKEKTKQFNSRDLQDVNFEEIVYEPKTADVFLYFSGLYFPRPKVLNYNGDTYVSEAIELQNIKRVSFCIRVSREEIYNEDFLRHIIYEYFDEREQYRVAGQIKYKLISRK